MRSRKRRSVDLEDDVDSETGDEESNTRSTRAGKPRRSRKKKKNRKKSRNNDMASTASVFTNPFNDQPAWRPMGIALHYRIDMKANIICGRILCIIMFIPIFSVSGGGVCQRRSLYINFSDLGWQVRDSSWTIKLISIFHKTVFFSSIV